MPTSLSFQCLQLIFYVICCCRTGYVYAQVVDSADTTYSNAIVPDRVRYDNGVCKNLNYTVYSSCEECEAVLVLTSDRRKVSQLMNDTDNHRFNQSWSILESQPDYAFDYARRLITVTNNNQFCDLQNFYTYSRNFRY